MFKTLVYLFIIAIENAGAGVNPVLTSWKQTTGFYQKFNTSSYLTDVTAIYNSNTLVYVVGQGIPSYTIGPWKANPNTPSGQNFIFAFSLSPTKNTGAASSNLLTSLGPIGAWSNAIPIFGPWDGFSYASLGIWHRNALVYEGISFDQCLGHPAGSGMYHNHVVLVCLYNLNNSAVHSPIIGYAFDGFPIYGPYGYSNASNSNSAIKLIVSGYALRSISNRTTLSSGTVLSSSYYGPPINSTYPLGSFLEDYTYSSSNGDLDACNGRWTG